MEGSRRTIIYVDNSTGLTGGFKSLMHVIRRLKHHYRIVVITPDSRFARKYLPDVDHYEIPFLELQKGWKSVGYPFALIRNAFRLRKIVNQYDDPILHMNDFYNLTGCGVKFLRPKTALIYHVRLLPTSYIGPIYHWLARIVLRVADRVICCSRVVFDALPDSSKKQVVYDAMEEPPKITHQNKESLEILYLANYIPGKGHDLAMEIFGHVEKLHPTVHMRFLGGTLGKPGNELYKKELKKRAQKIGVQDRLRFDGFVQNVHKEIQQATILLNCSESESFSMVCLEGLFNETCVVTLDSGGPAELINHGQTGLIFAKDTNAQEIATEIVGLLNNTELRAQLARQGKAFAMRNFSQKSTIKDLENIYSNI
jgi:glycosyltransferase involved in cell wall biosynthesis